MILSQTKERVSMFPIRMQKRACTDTEKISRFLAQAKTGFLGLSAGDIPYVVPLNFAWWKDAVYFHGASEGRKVTVMQQNSQACFTVSEEYGTITDAVPAHTDTAYMSVVIQGTVEHVSDLTEATEAMQSMLDKYVPGFYDTPLSRSHVEKYISSMGSRTAVYKLTPSSISAKENEANEHRMFNPGRTVHSDQRS
jgi:nitroimidazol reductase NimA-like FMN-containing flavoprotein (pyridoxamine 5'-phosphate oxidase superfamily)